MIVLADCELPKKTREELAALVAERRRLKTREDKLAAEKADFNRRVVKRLDKLSETSLRDQGDTLAIERGFRANVKPKLLKDLGVKQSLIDKATVRTPYERVSFTPAKKR